MREVCPGNFVLDDVSEKLQTSAISTSTKVMVPSTAEDDAGENFQSKRAGDFARPSGISASAVSVTELKVGSRAAESTKMPTMGFVPIDQR
jgi:hypothetical protein